MAKKKINKVEDFDLVLPMLPLPNFVLTPGIPQPLKIDDNDQQKWIDISIKNKSEILIIPSVPNEGAPEKETILEYGVVCRIDKMLQMPGAPTLAFVNPLYRAHLVEKVFSPLQPMAKISALPNIKVPKRLSAEGMALFEKIQNIFNALLNFIGETEREAAKKLVEDNSENTLSYFYAVSHVAPIDFEEKYSILAANSFLELIQALALALDSAEQRIKIQYAIHEKTHQEISRQQKENFLRIHLKQIKEELGESEEDDILQLINKSKSKKWTKETQLHFDKEIQKLRRLNVNNPEYSVQYDYLEAFLDLPWQNYKQNKISIEKVEEILNRDHYGLEKVKERILEYMAVVKLRNDLKAPILCLYGPPGVGKTSIGKSVAEAVGREYSRISLGGLHDEAEIRGHRKTYIGAMPGRFLHALSKCKNGNPLILLDEIDKVGKDFKGDPSSALLEALDPEQNNTFHDNYIDFPYDLSKVLFIATANDLNSIPAPLRDRMEVIEMPAYSNSEKKEIALRHLVALTLSDNGFKTGDIKFDPEAIDLIIRNYTKEAGVRQLKLQMGKIIRKLALMKVKGNEIPEVVTPELVRTLLDKNDSAFNRLGFRG